MPTPCYPHISSLTSFQLPRSPMTHSQVLVCYPKSLSHRQPSKPGHIQYLPNIKINALAANCLVSILSHQQQTPNMIVLSKIYFPFIKYYLKKKNCKEPEKLRSKMEEKSLGQLEWLDSKLNSSCKQVKAHVNTNTLHF